MEQPVGQSKGYWGNPKNWVALITMVAVLVYTGAQIYQTYLIRKNNIISQQAFVYADPMHTAPMLGVDKDGKNIAAIVVPLVNSGNTATKDLHLFVHCSAVSGDNIPEPWVLLNQGKIEDESQVIGPKAVATVSCTFKQDELAQMRDKKMYGYILGNISYKDRLDKDAEHITQFSWQIADVNFISGPNDKVLMAISLVPRGQHNCVDEDCPKEAATKH